MLFYSKELLILPYSIGYVIGEFTSGSGTFTIKGSGWYKLECVGAGGGGGNSYGYSSGGNSFSHSGGGSGAAWVGEAYLTAGTYNYTVGAKGSGKSSTAYNVQADGGTATTITNVITCNAGTGGLASWLNGYTVQHGGYGGSIPTVSVSSRNVTTNTAGANGGSVLEIVGTGSASGGASKYGGYGAGGNASGTSATDGGNGYIKITYKGA